MRGSRLSLAIAAGVMLATPLASAQDGSGPDSEPVVRSARATSLDGPQAEPAVRRSGGPVPIGYVRPAAAQQMAHQGMRRGPGMMRGGPQPAYVPGAGGRVARSSYDQPHLPGYAWPSYAAHPNYAALTYPKQYSPTAWPFIGPFYPYPQVPLGWRKVSLEWDDGWWMLDFKD